jgi:hypothetical protein
LKLKLPNFEREAKFSRAGVRRDLNYLVQGWLLVPFALPFGKVEIAHGMAGDVNGLSPQPRSEHFTRDKQLFSLVLLRSGDVANRRLIELTDEAGRSILADVNLRADLLEPRGTWISSPEPKYAARKAGTSTGALLLRIHSAVPLFVGRTVVMEP